MKWNGTKTNATMVNSTKSGSTKARDPMYKMAIMPVWHTSYPYKWKFMYLRPQSSSCRMCSRVVSKICSDFIFQMSIHDQITLTIGILCVFSMYQGPFKGFTCDLIPVITLQSRFYYCFLFIALLSFSMWGNWGTNWLSHLPKGYTAFKWHGQDLNPDSVIPESMGLITVLSSIYKYYK